jgi:catechol 2,3-dioxygenase-like lactoylglutathione lyase family enzyme
MQPHTIAQLAHVELLTPTHDESVAFFKSLLGMIETHSEQGSVYLRGYQDTYHHSLIVTESEHAGLGHADARAASALWETVDRQLTNNAEWVTTVDIREVELTSSHLQNCEYNPVWASSPTKHGCDSQPGRLGPLHQGVPATSKMPRADARVGRPGLAFPCGRARGTVHRA